MLFFILLAFLLGCANVISKMINYRATQELGTWNGSLVNYVVASALAFALLLCTGGFQSDSLIAWAEAPLYLYLGGTLGVIAFVISLVCLARMEVFQSTALLLIGQLRAGILFDVIVYQNFTTAFAFPFISVIGIFSIHIIFKIIYTISLSEIIFSKYCRSIFR